MIAGATGTLAMDLLWFARYKRAGGSSDFPEWEFSAGLDNWESAPAPAQLGKRLFEALFQTTLGPTDAALTNNLTHWGYGLAWGALFSIVVSSSRTPRVRFGLLFGPLVWATGYLVLVPAKLYKPMWEYDASTLRKDFSAHLVYGLASAATFKALIRARGHAAIDPV
jgi:uncharacterized membrane protein YagU involved in acid resistance